MKKDKVVSKENPAENADLLTGLLRSGARELIARAVQSGLAEFFAQYQGMRDDQGKALLVRNGYLPQREIMTGVGPVDIKVPKTRDRSGRGIHFRKEFHHGITFSHTISPAPFPRRHSRVCGNPADWQQTGFPLARECRDRQG